MGVQGPRKVYSTQYAQQLSDLSLLFHQAIIMDQEGPVLQPYFHAK